MFAAIGYGDASCGAGIFGGAGREGAFIEQLREVMEKAGIDALVAPTTPIAAPLMGEE